MQTDGKCANLAISISNPLDSYLYKHGNRGREILQHLFDAPGCTCYSRARSQICYCSLRTLLVRQHGSREVQTCLKMCAMRSFRESILPRSPPPTHTHPAASTVFEFL